MAGNTTQLTPNDVTDIANKHLNLANEITSDQRTLSSNIQNMTSVNKGAMMTALTPVYEDWNAKMTDIVQQLHTMATNLRTVANDLQAHDESNAAGVGR
ncbi:WXG100 family type VII secretion target [Kutzneria kofuensis]|uniref:WXG100 family type VII secretion target n=1 Tax=Kutzneria kofuensis TaxID=103725 RepID=A0A7W9KQU2_9PSEU|nr:WXG100 family type VII secretion target [Kutzneria kofuensis]MBB5896314.1 WXG100 family type VII secretion target [Kutzneria kofuensis]